MRILLIGGNGFIGRFVVTALQQQGHSPAVFHRGTAVAPAGVEQMLGDRDRLSASAAELKRFAPEVVIDLVISSGPQAEELMTLFRGTVRRVAPLSGLVTFDHEELPGILDQGSDFFRAAPELAAILKPGSACLARIERRDGAWRIFDVRLLVNRSQ